MLSRIMRHPAGLMRKALSRKFLAATFSRPESLAIQLPDYWRDRFAGSGLALLSTVPAPAASRPVALVHALHPEQAQLPAQAGRAASFLHPERTAAALPA